MDVPASRAQWMSSEVQECVLSDKEFERSITQSPMQNKCFPLEMYPHGQLYSIDTTEGI